MSESLRARLIETLSELIRIPSINPDLVPGATGEQALAEAIAARLRRTPGILVELHEAAPGRPNVVASLGSVEHGGRTLLLNGHLDTVGVEGMSQPFEPRVEAGRLYGRGAGDMKGALAAMIVLLESVAAAGDFPGRLVATFVADEEYASIGSAAICREIDRWRPDGALVLEDTELKAGIAHKGFVWAAIETHGFAAHGSKWELGVDAIAHMGRVLVALDDLGRELTSRPGHRWVGPPSLHASLIRGGQELSSYPASCRLDLERRTIPGETVEQIRQELQDMLDRLAAADHRFSASLTMGLVRQSFEVPGDAPIVRALADAWRQTAGTPIELVGEPWWTDAALFAAAGVPTVLFGPHGEGEHGEVEWVDLDSLETLYTVLARAARDFCGGGA